MSDLPADNLAAPAPPKYRIYSPAAVTWATVIGSIAAGGAVLALNYWRWGRKSEAWGSLLMGLLGVGALIALAQSLPERIPHAAFLVPQFFIAHQLTKSLQGRQLDAHLSAGGQLASNWKAAGIGAIYLILLVGAAFTWFIATDPDIRELLHPRESITVGKDQEIFYSQGATKETAEKLGAALKDAGYFLDGHPASVTLSGVGPDKQIGFVMGSTASNDPAILNVLRKIGDLVAPAIGGKPLTIQILDENLQEKNHIRLE